MKKTYGYIRVTPDDANEDRYLTQLTEAGAAADLIYKDEILSTATDCAALHRLFKELSPGDTLLIVRLDHLGENCDKVKEHWRVITKELRCDLAVLEMPALDTRQGESIKDIVLEVFESCAGIGRRRGPKRQFKEKTV